MKGMTDKTSLHRMFLLLLEIKPVVCIALLAISPFTLGDVAQESASSSVDGPSIQDEVESPLVVSRGDFASSVALYELLGKANLEQLGSLLEQSKKIPRRSLRQETQHAIFRRLAAIDPTIALGHLERVPRYERVPLVQGIYREWSLADLDAAVASAKSQSSSLRLGALEAMLKHRDDLPHSTRHEISIELGGEVYAQLQFSREIASNSMHAPGDAWNTVVTDEVDDTLQVQLLVQIAREWVEEIGVEVLAHLARSPMFRNRAAMKLVVADLADADPGRAFKYATRLKEEPGYLFLLETIASKWAESEPRAALSAVSGLVMDYRPLRNIELAVANSWNVHEPQGVLDEIERFSRTAQLEIVRRALNRLARTNPEAAVQRMVSMKDLIGSASNIAEGVVEIWSEQRPEAALGWVLSQAQDHDFNRLELIEAILPGLSRVDPERAMQVAMSESDPKAELGLEHVVILELSKFDVDKALEMLPQVSDSSSQLLSYMWVGSAIIRTGDLEKAIELGEQLPESVREIYFGEVASSWVHSNPKEMLDKIDSISSEEIQSVMASRLLEVNDNWQILTKDEVEKLKSLLVPDD